MKILYVEDDTRLRTSVAKLVFLNTNYQFVYCSTVEEARQAIDKYREEIDLIILDIILVHEHVDTGFDLLKYMQTGSIHIPVILTSGFSENYLKEIQHFEEANLISGVLSKPFTAENLASQISAIEKRNSRKRQVA